MRQLQSQTGGDVSVEVNAAPGQDLTKMLNDMREEYEEIIKKKQREIEQWFEVKVSHAHYYHIALEEKERDTFLQTKNKRKSINISYTKWHRLILIDHMWLLAAKQNPMLHISDEVHWWKYSMNKEYNSKGISDWGWCMSAKLSNMKIMRK